MSKYMRIERERRFVVTQLPAGLGPGTPIHDRYLRDVRLRVRRMGDQFKLGQKIPQGPSVCRMTNIYLDAEEHAHLAALPGWDLHKTRYHVVHAGRTWAVDVFEGSLSGLILTEVELDDEEPVVPPPFAGSEVTEDERYAGGRLARDGRPL